MRRKGEERRGEERRGEKRGYVGGMGGDACIEPNLRQKQQYQ